MKRDFNCQKGRKVIIKEKSVTQFIEMKDITHIECNGYISTVYTIDSVSYTVSKLLKHFEEELDRFGFVRANRSVLVNLNYVQKYISGSSRTLQLTNNITICISRRKAYIFKNY